MPTIFIVSDLDEQVRDRFCGYCFAGPDFIVGPAGCQAYREDSGQSVRPGEDGCYIVVQRDGNRVTIGADYSGYRRLFLYQSGSRWAASSSLLALLQHARANNLPLTLRSYHRRSQAIRGSLMEQLTSHRTAISEIRLCPRLAQIEVSTDGAKLVPLKLKPIEQTYADSLAEAICTWAGRLRTLANAGIEQRVSLTGGVDSRAVAAFYLHAMKHEELAAVFVSGTAARQLADLRIAKELAMKYRLPLNLKSTQVPIRTGEECIELWRHTCLGNYYPVRIPAEHGFPNSVSVGGSGGELHRKFDPDRDLEAMCRRFERYFSSKHQFRLWRSDIRESVLSWCPTGVDPLVFHYGEFRNRLHAGALPNSEYLISPLASSLFARCSSTLDSHELAQGRLLYDVMQNLLPGLATQPYDNDAKHPTESILDKTPRVPIRPVVGNVYGSVEKKAISDTGGGRLDSLELRDCTTARVGQVNHRSSEICCRGTQWPP